VIHFSIQRYALLALAAALFGASTPLAKLLLGEMSLAMLAGGASGVLPARVLTWGTAALRQIAAHDLGERGEHKEAGRPDELHHVARPAFFTTSFAPWHAHASP